MMPAQRPTAYLIDPLPSSAGPRTIAPGRITYGHRTYMSLYITLLKLARLEHIGHFMRDLARQLSRDNLYMLNIPRANKGISNLHAAGEAVASVRHVEANGRRKSQGACDDMGCCGLGAVPLYAAVYNRFDLMVLQARFSKSALSGRNRQFRRLHIQRRLTYLNDP